MKKLIPITIIAAVLAVAFCVLWIFEKTDTTDVEELCQVSVKMAFDDIEGFVESGDDAHYLSCVANYKSFLNAYLIYSGGPTPEYTWSNILYGYMVSTPNRVERNAVDLRDALQILSKNFTNKNGYMAINRLNYALDEYATSLEFQITENVEDVDFSKYYEIPGWMGARQFYGKSYLPTVDVNGELILPEHYVSYLVTAYPDYSDGGMYVTEIEITDPRVEVHGLTVDSSFTDFRAVFEAMGYELAQEDDYIRAFKDGIFYRLENGKMTVSAYVSNREGIVF